MVTYARNEMVGVTELSQSLGEYLDKVISNPFNKLAIIRQNEPEAVIIPITEYEHMRQSTDMLEDMEIAQVIKERMLNKDKAPEFIEEDEMFTYLKSRGCDV